MVKHHKEEISSIVIPSVSHGHVWALLDRRPIDMCSLITCISSSKCEQSFPGDSLPERFPTGTQQPGSRTAAEAFLT